MKNEDILISVVMPTYNDEEYLKEAIDSILNQSYTHFEFIIVNDGSTDATEEIIKSYSDSRICYYRLPENKGNAFARNVGMANTKGKYIAHMDSDDICVHDRLETQLNYLEKHPDIDVLGGGMRIFDQKGRGQEVFRPVNAEYASAFCYFKNMLWQPTVMLRREKIKQSCISYNPARENMEDYDFWFQVVWKGLKLMSLPKVLLLHRVSDSQMSHPARLDGRNTMLLDFFKERLALMGLDLREEEIILLHSFIRGRIKIKNIDEYNSIRQGLSRLEERNNELRKFSQKAFKAALFFFRLRLIKYYYLERKKYLSFLQRFIELNIHTGLPAIYLFWKNERRNLFPD